MTCKMKNSKIRLIILLQLINANRERIIQSSIGQSDSVLLCIVRKYFILIIIL
ncbi:unnamed protein product [Brugia timori]|uniref:Uncharacterized protein n=1 Tax=Brugia timori TaxID=42155 RepID=A0A158PSW3_9BILA|nr:unnamed protein product [Brugia timori]